MPRSSKPPLPVSTSEWIPSESIAELPVKPAAMNFVIAIAKLPAIAAYTALLDSAIHISRFNLACKRCPLLAHGGSNDHPARRHQATRWNRNAAGEPRIGTDRHLSTERFAL